MSNKLVYLFSEGNGSMRNLLGGKGANLAEMTNLGLPVPQGFTSEEFVTVMLEKAHVVVPPGNGYGKGGEGFFRIALTRPVDELREALRRMKRAGISYKMTK